MARDTGEVEKNLFFLGIILAASGLISPPIALAMGLLFGFTLQHPYQADGRKLSKFLLEVSVVGLGFGMSLHQVVQAGRSGFVYTTVSIAAAIAVGLALGQLFRVDRGASFLIATGTAICGGSAIAALGPIIDATEEEMAVSLGTVFVLNSVALLAFPAVGWALHLTQEQFGLWAALAIHDTSSVVGATAKYGAIALTVGTTVKLARALWIVPVSVATAIARKSKAKIRWPWFILFFCLAAVANTYLSGMHTVFQSCYRLGTQGLTVTLYLIGAGISMPMLKKVGVRPLLQGVLLWIIVAVTSLELIRLGWIKL